MNYLCPRDRRLELFHDLRPLTASDRTQNGGSSKNPKHSTRLSKRLNKRPESAQNEWGSRKPKNLAPINIDRELEKTRRVLGAAEKTNFSVVNKVGSPGGHISRIEADKRGERSPTKPTEIKMFCFSENIEDLMSYHTKDSYDRPAWESSFTNDHIERAAKAKEKRLQKRAYLKSLTLSQNAINVTMHDVVAMYTTPHIGRVPTMETPIHLNDDEIHVWHKLRESLYNCGQYFSHKAIDEVAAKHRDSERSANDNPIFVHFLRYMNIVLGGSKSLAAAKVILLNDVSYLLRLLQEIDIFKLPLDSLREATAFRMREMSRIGEQLQTQFQNGDLQSVTSTLTGDNMTQVSEQRNTVFSIVDDGSARTKIAAQKVLYSQISSLLAKIALISAERTSLKSLLSNKKKNKNGAVTVLRRRTPAKFGISAHELFGRGGAHSYDFDTDEDGECVKDSDEGKSTREITQTSRRVSLSMILGVAPGSSPDERFDRKVLIRQESEHVLTEEEIADLRKEFFGVEVPVATDFKSIPRRSTSGYHSLETLLKPYCNDQSADLDPPFLSQQSSERINVSASVEGGLTLDTDCIFSNISGDSRIESEGSPAPTGIDSGEFFEMNGSDQKTKFRFNKQGDVYVTDGDGNYTRCAKNMSMYYDMLTEEETMTSLSRLTNSVHEMTANDMFKSRLNDDEIKSKCVPGQSVEDYLQKQKQRALEENADFVETLARIAELHTDGSPSERSPVITPTVNSYGEHETGDV